MPLLPLTLLNMNASELLPNLFRSEYQKIVAVLVRMFGITHVETAEDLVSDTFLAATESWSHLGIPDHPSAWLYAVAKNKTKNYLKRSSLFDQKLVPDLRHDTSLVTDWEPDMSPQNISDSQLAMIFAVCNPAITAESQIALALNLLCGFGAQEIADAFLTNKEVIYKRITRARMKLKEINVPISQPPAHEIAPRLDTVLTTLYLLFNEGYYSTSQHTVLRKDFCLEAMRLTYLLIQNAATSSPRIHALMALMCFHASRFDARTRSTGDSVLYQDQDESLWNQELIHRGKYFLSNASAGSQLSKYHLEAGIAYWHTHKEDSPQKWQSILELYDHLLEIENSPIAALNRVFAISKVHGKRQAIAAATPLQLTDHLFYHTLMGHLHTDLDNPKAIAHYQLALNMATSEADQNTIKGNLEKLVSR